MFFFLKGIISDKWPPLYDYLTLYPTYPTYPPIHFRKIDMSTKNYGGFIRLPPPSLFRGGDDAMSLQYSQDKTSVRVNFY